MLGREHPAGTGKVLSGGQILGSAPRQLRTSPSSNDEGSPPSFPQPTAMEVVTTLLLGALASLTASFMVLFVLSRLKPQLKISPVIGKGSNSRGVSCYRIKVINLGRRPIFDMRARLHLVTPANVRGGPIDRTQYIELRQSEIFMLHRFDRNDQEAKYAFRFLTYAPLEDLERRSPAPPPYCLRQRFPFRFWEGLRREVLHKGEYSDGNL